MPVDGRGSVNSRTLRGVSHTDGEVAPARRSLGEQMLHQS
jgi:hypothetical protein